MSRVTTLSPSVNRSEIKYYPVDSLIPHARNARKHTKKQIRQIRASIEEFGFTNPILIGAGGSIIAGHGRLEAAKLLGMIEVPTVCLAHLTPAQQRAYVIADNRLAEKAGWDNELLRLELGDLADLDFNITLTGFDTAEADALITPMLSDNEEDVIPEPPGSPVSRSGDLWLIGPHRLFCGDSTVESSYVAALGGETAGMVFTDPPYNVKIKGNVSGNRRHGEFVMASGEMSAAEFTSFLHAFMVAAKAQTRDGALLFTCIDWRHMSEIMQAAQDLFELKNVCVWNKANAGMGSLYRSKHELVFVYKSGTAPHVNNIELGKHGRNRTNVWNYAGATSMHKGRSKRLEMHPTVKPVVMIADAIKDCSNRNDWILDPFGGSGSTLLAAHDTGRRAALIELDPRYVDVSIARVQRCTDLTVIHAESGLSFSEVRRERAVAEVVHG